MATKREAYRITDKAVYKRCTGPTHQDTVWLTLDKFWYSRPNGKPRPSGWCKECTRYAKNVEAFVKVSVIRFAVTELVHRLGVDEAGRRIGLSKTGFYRIYKNRSMFVQKRTAVRILATLAEVRKNDEVRHRDSISYGHAARGLPERPVEDRYKDIYRRHGDTDNANQRNRRRR